MPGDRSSPRTRPARGLLQPLRGEPRHALPALAVVVIVALALVPGTPAPDPQDLARVFTWVPPAVQNLLHVPVYGGFTWLWLRAGHDRGPTPRLTAALTAAVAMALVDETIQLARPGRYASMTDLTLDAAGALCAVLLYERLSRRPITPANR